jgi:hypothetical protein
LIKKQNIKVKVKSDDEKVPAKLLLVKKKKNKTFPQGINITQRTKLRAVESNKLSENHQIA